MINVTKSDLSPAINEIPNGRQKLRDKTPLFGSFCLCTIDTDFLPKVAMDRLPTISDLLGYMSIGCWLFAQFP